MLTTVGYGDFSGDTSREMIFSIALEFGGLLLFSILTGLLVQLVSVGGGYDSMLADYLERLNVWIMKLEKANDADRNTFMPAELYRAITDYTEAAFRHDHNLVVE